MFNFEIHDDFLAIALLYADHFSVAELRKELAGAINQSLTKARKAQLAYAKKEYNFDSDVLTKQGRVRSKRARADKDQMEAGLFISSKPVSLRTFVVATNPIAVLVRQRTNMPQAFLVDVDGQSKVAGVFMRDTARAKYAPTKGRYAGRILTRGSNKGQRLLRQAIDKKYTLTTAQVAYKGADDAITRADMVGTYEARLEKRLKKMQTGAV